MNVLKILEILKNHFPDRQELEPQDLKDIAGEINEKIKDDEPSSVIIMEHMATGVWKPLIDENGIIIIFEDKAEALKWIEDDKEQYDQQLCDPYVADWRVI